MFYRVNQLQMAMFYRELLSYQTGITHGRHDADCPMGPSLHLETQRKWLLDEAMVESLGFSIGMSLGFPMIMTYPDFCQI